MEASGVELGGHAAQGGEASELLDDVVDDDGGGAHSAVSLLEGWESVQRGTGGNVTIGIPSAKLSAGSSTA